jgi:hypothetical protein
LGRYFGLVTVEFDAVQSSQIDSDAVLVHLEGICPIISSFRKKSEIRINAISNLFLIKQG